MLSSIIFLFQPFKEVESLRSSGLCGTDGGLDVAPRVQFANPDLSSLFLSGQVIVDQEMEGPETQSLCSRIDNALVN